MILTDVRPLPLFNLYTRNTKNRSGTAQSGSLTTITLDAGASAVADFYKHARVTITGGTGVGQQRIATAYNGGSKVLTVGLNWFVDPDATSTFKVEYPMRWAAKDITYQGMPFTKKVISFGRVSQTLSYPPGSVESGNVTVRIEDTTGDIRAMFETDSPFLCVGELMLSQESRADDSHSDPPFGPVFTGEVIHGGVEFSPGECRITMRSLMSAWLERPIPSLINRYNFPDLPDDIDEAFAPIALGQVYGYSATNVEPQGAINCPYVDTTLFRYMVARHTCFSVPIVYRKRKLDARYFVVDVSEYSIVDTDPITINGIEYFPTYVQFSIQQEDGTLINVDVSGLDYAYDFDLQAQTAGSTERRNPTDAISSLIYYLLLANETTVRTFDNDSFIETWDRCDARGYLCDIAFTEPITGGVALSMIQSDFLLDLFGSPTGAIKIWMYHEELDTDLSPNVTQPVDDTIVLRNTLRPILPEKVFNRFRYRYFKQYAEREQYTGRHSGFDLEFTLDNVADQAEMITIGANPLLEQPNDLHSIRNATNATNVTKRRLYYHTLRSHLVEFEASAPLYQNAYALAVVASITHDDGMGGAGWTDYAMKIIGVEINLDAAGGSGWEMRVKAVRVEQISDVDIEDSFVALPARAVQVRYPMLAARINGTLVTGDPAPDADPVANFNDTTPAAPSPTTISDGGVGLGYTSNPAYNGLEVQYRLVKWLENINPTGTMREVSAYVESHAEIIESVADDVETLEANQFWAGTLLDFIYNLNAGDVGIGPGTSFTPAAKLHVRKSSSGAVYITVENQGTGDVGIDIARTGTTPSEWQWVMPSGQTYLKLHNANENTDPLYIKGESVFVGIGMIPTAPLTVSGTIESGRGVARVIYPHAKTDTTDRNVAAWTSNEGTAATWKLMLLAKGSATDALRQFSLQTGTEGVASGGNLILQPSAGLVGIGIVPTGPLTVAGVAESGRGVQRVIYAFARTDTADRDVASWTSNESTIQTWKLLLQAKGSATAADRRFSFQTGTEGVASGGDLVFQPGAGRVVVGNASNDAASGLIFGSSKLTLFQDGTNGIVQGGGSLKLRPLNTSNNVIMDALANVLISTTNGSHLGLDNGSAGGGLIRFGTSLKSVLLGANDGSQLTINSGSAYTQLAAGGVPTGSTDDSFVTIDGSGLLKQRSNVISRIAAVEALTPVEEFTCDFGEVTDYTLCDALEYLDNRINTARAYSENLVAGEASTREAADLALAADLATNYVPWTYIQSVFFCDDICDCLIDNDFCGFPGG